MFLRISIRPLDVILALVARIQAGAKYATCSDCRDKPENDDDRGEGGNDL
jgi:hypothetical protein